MNPSDPDTFILWTRCQKLDVLTRRGLDWTERFRAIAAELQILKRRNAYLDGEIVVLTADGISDFGGLDAISTDSQRQRLGYYVFDLLHLGGKNLRGESLRGRNAKLTELLASVKMARVRYSEHIDSDGAAFYKRGCKVGLKGIISKRADKPHRSGRIGDWLKVKCTKRQEFVVRGWLQPEKKGRDLASLLRLPVSSCRVGAWSPIFPGVIGFSPSRRLRRVASSHSGRRTMIPALSRAAAVQSGGYEASDSIH